MITCVRDSIELSGTAPSLLGEFAVIAYSLRKALLHKVDEKTVREVMDAAYNFWEEGKTC